MAHSKDETALGRPLRNESGSKSLAYQYDKHSKADVKNHQTFLNVIWLVKYLKILHIVPIHTDIETFCR